MNDKELALLLSETVRLELEQDKLTSSRRWSCNKCGHTLPNGPLASFTGDCCGFRCEGKYELKDDSKEDTND